MLWGFLFCSYVSLCKLTGNMHGSQCQMRIQSKERQQLQLEGAHVLRCTRIRYNVWCVCGANWWLSALLLSPQTLWKLGAVRPIVPASVYHFCHSRSAEGQAVCGDALQHPRNTKKCQRGFFRNYRLKMEWHTELPQACTTGNIKTTHHHHHLIQLCRASVQHFPLVALVFPTYIYLNTVLQYNSEVGLLSWAFQFSATLYFHSTTTSITLVTSYSADRPVPITPMLIPLPTMPTGIQFVHTCNIYLIGSYFWYLNKCIQYVLNTCI